MTAEFWSTIAGAIVGGLIAFLIQLTSFKAASNNRKAAAEERQQALGRAVLFKTLTIHSNFEVTNRYLQGQMELAKILEVGDEPWKIVKPLSYVPPDVAFTTDEMSLMLSMKDDYLFNKLAVLDQIHNATMAILRTYAIERSNLIAVLPASIVGHVGLIDDLTVEETKRLEPKIAEVNSLAEALLSRFKQDADESGLLLDRLMELLRSKLGLELSLAAKAIGGEAI